MAEEGGHGSSPREDDDRRAERVRHGRRMRREHRAHVALEYLPIHILQGKDASVGTHHHHHKHDEQLQSPGTHGEDHAAVPARTSPR